MTSITRPLMRYHGGKFRLAAWILSTFPPHRIYTEAYGGAASVLLSKPRAEGEVYNDLDGEIVNLFRVLRQPELSGQLAGACALTPYAHREFELARKPADDPLERARRTLVRAQMSFGSAGATQGSTGFRIDLRRRHTVQADWASYPPILEWVTQRLQGVLIENRPALEVLAQHDSSETLHFVDPPYVHAARSRSGAYQHEMTDAEHRMLLETVRGLRGMVVLCGYDNAVYREGLAEWIVKTTVARAGGQQGTAMRTECLWLNSACAERSGWLFGIDTNADACAA